MIISEVKAQFGAKVYISDDYAVKDKAEAERIIAEQNSIANRMMRRRFAANAKARECMEYDGGVDDESV